MTRRSLGATQTASARELKDDPARLYVDYELVAANRNPRAGAQIGRLKREWRGHPARTLAIVSYEKVSEQTLVVLVES